MIQKQQNCCKSGGRVGKINICRGGSYHAFLPPTNNSIKLAESLIEAEKLSERGDDKLASFIEDDASDRIKREDIPLINRFLKELGSHQQIELE
jgi:hypothetical protein